MLNYTFKTCEMVIFSQLYFTTLLPVMVAHSYNSRIWEANGGRLQFQPQSGQLSETLYQNKKTETSWAIAQCEAPEFDP